MQIPTTSPAGDHQAGDALAGAEVQVRDQAAKVPHGQTVRNLVPAGLG